jgi:hypothetical protein
MIAFWERSLKIYAKGELRYWRGVLRELDQQTGHERVD